MLHPEEYDPVRAHRFGARELSAAAKDILGAGGGGGCDAVGEDEEENLLFNIMVLFEVVASPNRRRYQDMWSIGGKKS